jgi:hypothetical protein
MGAIFLPLGEEKDKMLVRKLIATLIVAIMGATLVILALPTHVANACLPCNCKTHRTVNCFGRYGVYILQNGDSCAIRVLDIDDEGRSSRAIDLSARELAELPEFPEENILVDEYYEIAFYKLTTGEYQVNSGPDAEGKVFVLNFTGCPAENVYESTFISDGPVTQLTNEAQAG